MSDDRKQSQIPSGAIHTEGPENPWIQTSRAIAYENDWIVVYHDHVVRPDGQQGIYGVVHYRSRSVGVIAVDPQERVLLVGQYRYPLGCYSWEIPGGGAAEGEEPIATARRELREETGFSAGSVRLILRAHLSNSTTDEEALCYLATELVPGESCPEGTERIDARWVPFQEALDLIRQGQITDALTILGLFQIALLEAERGRD